MVLMRPMLYALSLALLSAAAHCQPAYSNDMTLDDYLSALGAITPAARDGAEAYLQAYRTNCGRAMRLGQPRHAVAEGNGNPVLMALIRAAHYKDAAQIRELSRQVACVS